MNPAKQFWTLFKFQLIANPFLWLFMLTLCIPILFMPSADLYLDTIIRNQNLFFVGLLGVMLLAPEIMGSYASNQYPIFASEFLLTRAVDRGVFARAKSAGFYFLVLVVPVFLLLSSLRSPDLKVIALSESDNRECLSAIPRSVIVKNPHGLDRIAIPSGKILVAGWRLWASLATAASVQLLIFIIYPFSYRKYLLWGIFGIGIVAPLLALYFKFELFTGERLFFIFAKHQTLFWIETFFFVMLSQRWCERRFARQEF